jgi:murein DD-endopeptidase MepM/ murein hydrolase activator NlpD
MPAPRRFSVLIVHGNGARTIRLSVASWVPYGAIVLLLLAVPIQAVLWTDYLGLKRRATEVTASHEELRAQRALHEAIGRRVAEVSAEVTAASELQAALWKTVDPEQLKGRNRVGIGGGATQVARPSMEGLSLTAQLDTLLGTLREEGRNLEALTRFMGRAGKALAALPSRWPVRGTVNSEFGRRRSPWTGAPEFHEGIDIAASSGTQVRAPAPGVVEIAGRSPGLGNTVVLDHGQDVKTRFGHLQTIRVARGQRVDRGELIALTGSTGSSTGPHLHYEVLVRGRAVNPRIYFWE